MATPLYLISTVAEVNPGAEDERALSLTRGGGVVSSDATATVLGPTAGVQIKIGTVVACWISPPLAAVTIAGTVTFNLWGLESANQANTAFDVLVQRLDNAGAVLSTISRSERGIELTTSALVNLWTATPTSTALSVGDRIKVTVFGNDAGGTMASGRTFTLTYNGTSAAANGDSYVQFFETLVVARLGTLAATQADQTLSSAGTVVVAGTLAATQAAQSLSSVGTVAIAGTLASTQAAHTLASVGTVAVAGALGADPLLVDLVAYWKMDEASGTRADATGRGNDLLEVGGAVASVPGRVGNAASFEIEASSYLRASSSPDLITGTTDYAWALWANVSAETVFVPWVSKYEGFYAKTEYYLSADLAYDEAALFFWNGAPPFVSVNCTIQAPLIPGTWYFFVFQYDVTARRASASLNGAALIYSDAVGTGDHATLTTTDPVLVGADPLNFIPYETHRMDEMGRWNRLLTMSEIVQLYNLGSGQTYPFRTSGVQAGDTLTAAGAVSIVGDGAATQADQSLSSIGVAAIDGTLAAEQAGDTLTAEGTVTGGSRRKRVIHLPLREQLRPARDGTLAVIQNAQSLASSGVVGGGGTLASIQDAQSLASSGTVGGVGRVAARQAGDTLASHGTIGIAATLDCRQAGDTLASSGVVAVHGSLNATQKGQALRSRGMVFGDGTDDLMILGLESEDEELLLLA